MHEADGHVSLDDAPGVSLPARWAHLSQRFRERYGSAPTAFLRAPGRVNLIGEHIDYNGLPVLPVALQREVAIVLAPRSDARVRIANARGLHGEREVPVRSDTPAGPPGDWGNYLIAPVRYLAGVHGELVGFDAILDSDVPVAAGLSSSAALVVAVGLALSTVNDLGLDRVSLAESMAVAERFVGTDAGGMDQAISLGARAGHATRIDFNPLRWTHVPIPRGWCFFVAHSLAPAEKSAGAQEAYNRRTNESRVALNKVRQALGEEDDVDYPDLLARHPTASLVERAAEALDSVLFRRFRHVITEAKRVADAETALVEGNPIAFGALMEASHLSLRNDYEVSSRDLDRLVGLTRDAGAHGARLTGAGFGGCIVGLTDEAHAEDLLDEIDRGYYAARSGIPPRDERLFVVRPSDGATVERLG